MESGIGDSDVGTPIGLRRIDERPHRHLSPIDCRQPPLLSESLRILVEKSLGIDPVSHEGPAPEVVHKKIMRHGQLKTRPPRPLGEIIIIETPNAKPLIEPADRVINGSLHEKAKPRQLRRIEPRPKVLLAPLPGEPVHVRDIAIRHLFHQLRRSRVIGHGSDEPNGASSRQ